MAAGGFREFVAGSTLDEDAINDFLMQGILVFAGTAARGSAITAPVEGQFTFRTDDDVLEFFDGSDFVEYSGAPPLFDFLVVAGGGGSGARLNRSSSAGGAGGYRNSVTGELTGGSATAEPALFLPAGTVTVTVGGGGSTSGDTGTRGSHSQFGQIIAYGGGQGSGSDPSGGVMSAGHGGSGAGEGGDRGGLGKGLQNQGFDGGTDVFNAASGGGGGAGVVGGNATGVVSVSGTGGNGGAGLASSITGLSVTRAGGGGGGARDTGGTGGTGGGGAGGAGATPGSAGVINTGGGAGGSGYTATAGAAGGSGIVVIKYPASITLTIDAGLTSSTSSAGGFKTTIFAGGTGPVSF